MPSVKLVPWQMHTLCMRGLGDWDGSSQPPLGYWWVQHLFENATDYHVRYVKSESITIYSPRGLQGGAIYDTGSMQRYPVLTDLGVICQGNVSVSTLDSADTVQAINLAITPGTGTKHTYYLSKRDEAKVWDYAIIKQNKTIRLQNPQLVGLSLDNNAPPHQAQDIYCDFRITC